MKKSYESVVETIISRNILDYCCEKYNCVRATVNWVRMTISDCGNVHFTSKIIFSLSNFEQKEIIVEGLLNQDGEVKIW